MPDITNPQAVKFDNEAIRPFARRYIQLYREAKALDQAWNAQSLSAVITNTADVVVDGAAGDGRPVATGAKLTLIITRAQQLVTDLEQTSNAKLNTLLAVDRGVD